MFFFVVKLAALGSGAGMNSHAMHFDQGQERFLLADDDNAEMFRDLQLNKNQVHI